MLMGRDVLARQNVLQASSYCLPQQNQRVPAHSFISESLKMADDNDQRTKWILVSRPNFSIFEWQNEVNTSDYNYGTVWKFGKAYLTYSRKSSSRKGTLLHNPREQSENLPDTILL